MADSWPRAESCLPFGEEPYQDLTGFHTFLSMAKTTCNVAVIPKLSLAQSSEMFPIYFRQLGFDSHYMEPIAFQSVQHTLFFLPILKFMSGEVLGRKSEPLEVELVPLEFRLHKAWDIDLWFECLGVDSAVAPDPLQSEIRVWKTHE